jgi:hypothetical protein
MGYKPVEGGLWRRSDMFFGRGQRCSMRCESYGIEMSLKQATLYCTLPVDARDIRAEIKAPINDVLTSKVEKTEAPKPSKTSRERA